MRRRLAGGFGRSNPGKVLRNQLQRVRGQDPGWLRLEHGRAFVPQTARMRMNNRRPQVSLLLLFALITIAITSALLYLLPHSNRTAAVHTTVGLAFLLTVGFHLRNNWKAVLKYAGRRGDRAPSASLIGTLACVSVVAVGTWQDWVPFRPVYALGDQLRSQQDREGPATEITYQIIRGDTPVGEENLSVEVTKGPKDYYSVMVIWIEDPEGRYLRTLYATRNIATGTFWQEVDGEPQRVPVRRPEAVPYWAHKRGVTEVDGLNVPTPETPLPDAITSATPVSHYVLKTRLDPAEHARFRVLFEVNRSYDWNEHYHEDAFPDDPVYSGNGYVGQPSLIYATPFIDMSDPRQTYLMEVIGHGHHSGRDGALYPDLSHITTALGITERVLVVVGKGA